MDTITFIKIDRSEVFDAAHDEESLIYIWDGEESTMKGFRIIKGLAFLDGYRCDPVSAKLYINQVAGEFYVLTLGT